MTSQASSKQAYNMRYLVRIRKKKSTALQRVILKDTSAFRHMILSVLKIITIKVTIINTQGYDFSQKLSLSSVTAKVSLQALIQGKKVINYIPTFHIELSLSSVVVFLVFLVSLRMEDSDKPWRFSSCRLQSKKYGLSTACPHMQKNSRIKLQTKRELISLRLEGHF